MSQQDPTPEPKHSILIVDDFEPDIIYAKLMLERTGVWRHVLVARNAQEALEMFDDYVNNQREHPDGFPPLAILLDINMPGMNGFEFLDVYESNYMNDSTAVIFMLSSSEDGDDVDRALSYKSVRSYLVKPLTLEKAQHLLELFGLS